jgi:flavodoxin
VLTAYCKTAGGEKMDIQKVKLVYFSPTGTSRKIMESIAEGIAVEDVEQVDMTLSENAQETIPQFSDELVIIGAPVTAVAYA